MSASLGLYRLQQVDSQIDRVRSNLDAIRKTLENDAELRAALTNVENAQSAHYHAGNSLKNAQAETQSQKEKIIHAESSLYGGGVKNPKELQDLQKDVASLKKHLATLEERELEAMVAAEESDKSLQAAKLELETMQSRLGNEHKKLVEEQSELTKDIERLVEEREAALAPIEHELLQSYEILRQQKRGIAVTQTSDNCCSSCGTTIIASLAQNARSSKLAYCPTCGRILFVN